MLIGKNIKNILGGGYNVSEVKYMDKTVWNSRKNITIEVEVDANLNLIIKNKAYRTGTYSFTMANDEDLKLRASGLIPGKRIVWEGETPYHKIQSINTFIESSNGAQIGRGYSVSNNDKKDSYLSAENSASSESFKNGDKIIIKAYVLYHLEKMY